MKKAKAGHVFYSHAHFHTVQEIEKMLKSCSFETVSVKAISQLRNKEISEIRYDCGKPGSIRIYLDEEGNLAGEYSCKTKASLLSFVKKLSVF